MNYLSGKGARVRLGERLKTITFDLDRVIALEIADRTQPISPDDIVVLATPPWVTGELLPDVPVPDEFSAIVNAHFKIEPPETAPGMLGLIGGTAEWVFAFPDRISVTVSGADRLVDMGREELAEILWRDVAKVHGLPEALPPWQVVKEKRATFAATPAQAKNAPRRRRAGKTSSLRAIGPIRACPPPSKAPFVPATKPPNWRWPRAL